MFETILVATDGSEHSRRAVAAAAELAARCGARLHVLHAASRGGVPAPLAHMAEVEHLVRTESHRSHHVADVSGNLALAHGEGETHAHRTEVQVAIGERIVAEAAAAARDRGAPEVLTRVELGDAAKTVLAVAEKVDADLVVLGSRGFSDLKGLLLGSVSHKVCQLAPCACLTVK